MLGLGSLTLPSAFARLGWVFALVLMGLCCAGTLYSGRLFTMLTLQVRKRLLTTSAAAGTCVGQIQYTPQQRQAPGTAQWRPCAACIPAASATLLLSSGAPNRHLGIFRVRWRGGALPTSLVGTKVRMEVPCGTHLQKYHTCVDTPRRACSA